MIFHQLFDPVNKNERLDWFEAEVYCKGLGGHLASIQSGFGLATIASASQLSTKGGKGFWIGLNNLNKTLGYQWIDGKPTSFFNWNNGEPNNFNGIEECVEVQSNQGWNDVNCYLNKGWICKIAKGITPPTTPIVVPETFPGNITKNSSSLIYKCLIS